MINKLSLPFEGYSWNFSQHAIAMQPSNLFSLLSAAALFEGQFGFGGNINKVLIENQILTSNIRNGKPDAWRDYQQILAETGLIFSTKLERNLRITEAGRLLLIGEIGFSEMMSIQSLRYQYPNGLKNTFANDQINSGVLIKPGVLILRILLELFKSGEVARVTIDQCQNYLLPIKRNDLWKSALNNIRANPIANNAINRHARRNIQDWFKFLSVTSIFELHNEGREVFVHLSDKVTKNIEFYDSICLYCEQPDTFWIPHAFDKMSFVSWFTFFGHIPTDYYDLLEQDMSDDYIKSNYYDSSDQNEDVFVNKVKNITLSEIPSEGINISSTLNYLQGDQKINSGLIKRIEKTKLHNEMVNHLSSYYRELGYSTYDDKQSIDLLVKSVKEETAIFEVKTATLRNIFSRSRLAVGQVMEYGYRYNQNYGINPSKNVVFNIDMEKESWLKTYMTDHLKIGLVSILGNKIKIFNPQI
jgi:hypothetical protein